MHRNPRIAWTCVAFAALVAVAANPTAYADEPHIPRSSLHLELGAGLPTAGHLSPPGTRDHTAHVGIVGWLSVDFVLKGPFAIEAIGGGGRMFELYDLNPDQPGGRNPTNGFSWFTFGIGGRLRFLEHAAEDAEGHRLRQGNFWVSTHIGYYRFAGRQFGVDAAFGHEWGISRAFGMGIFARGFMGLNGHGRPWVPGERETVAALFAGLSGTFDLTARRVDDTPAPTPPGDSDGDGITDDVDGCAAVAEDMDGFEDADGCPDRDDDGDGVMDGHDTCAHEAEDVDGFEDTDGCIDADNDQDSIADADDQCPMEPGTQDLGGCPDPDRDHDGVPNRVDNCPDEAGTQANQGCAEAQLVSIEDGRLETLNRIMFRTGSYVIDPSSYPVLEDVAEVLNSHPEITLMSIEGHTDETGSAHGNELLSARRAHAVVEHLVRFGHVDASRLVARGFSADRPHVADADSSADHRENRRVELRIVNTP